MLNPLDEHLEAIDAEVSLKQEIETEFIELWQNRSVVNPITGEIIDLFDWSIPTEQKADAFAWVLDKLDKEQDIVKEREKMWQERRKKLLIIIDKLKVLYTQQLKNEGKSKVKTPENTIYTIERTKEAYNLEDLEIRDCIVDMKITCDGYTAEHIQELLGGIKDLVIMITKKRANPAVMQRLLEEGKAIEVTNTILCRR